MSTKIEWCDETINPIVGCTKISPACDHCYAERMANRLAGIRHSAYKYAPVVTNGKWNGKTVFDRAELQKPKLWKKPRRIFISSMGDLFHSDVSDSDLVEILFMVKENPQHTFIMLTKRPHRMNEFFNNCVINPFLEPLPNLWLGVTVENQKQADIRIPFLLDIPAAIRFISIEPMLSNIDLRPFLYEGPLLKILVIAEKMNISPYDAANELYKSQPEQFTLTNKLNWVIVGGENGPGSRGMHSSWVNNILIQCIAACTPLFFKGWGGNSKTSIKTIDGKYYNQYPIQDCKNYQSGEPEKNRGFMHCDGDGHPMCYECKFFKQ
jgi:protein gp37